MEYILPFTFAYNVMRLSQKARTVATLHMMLACGDQVNGMKITPMYAPLKVQRRVQYTFDEYCNGYTDYQVIFKQRYDRGIRMLPIPLHIGLHQVEYSVAQRQETTISIQEKQEVVARDDIPLIYDKVYIQLDGRDTYSIMNTYDSGRSVHFYVLRDTDGIVHGVGLGQDTLASYATRAYDSSMLLNLYVLYGCIVLIPIVVLLR